MMLINVYWNKRTGEVLVPTIVKTDAGFWLEVEPVERATATDLPSLGRAILSVAERGAATVPTPPRTMLSQHVVLKHSTVKSDKAFERQYGQASIDKTSDMKLRIVAYRASPEGTGRVVDLERSKVMPAGSLLEGLIPELSRFIQNAS
jgi:hypothetical protein